MSIVLNDNLKIEAPKLIDARFGPHANLGAALAFITPALREMGLIFFVKDGSNLLEYWWPTTDLSDSGIALRSYQPLDADLTAIANIIDGGTGFLKKTAPNTWSLDTTVVTASTAAGGELEGYYPNPTLKNTSVINKVLAGFNTVGGGTIVDGDSILVAFGKVQNQLNALYGGMQFIDFWDASTNTPTILTAALGNKGNYYIVQVAGSTNIGGITDWRVGDWVVSNGSVWSKIDNTDAVVSVNGETGIVTLTTSHIEEGTRLYYTDLRVKTYADTLYSVLGHTHTFASLTSKPTTISGYGITDAYIKSEIDNFFGGIVGISGYNKTNWDAAFGWGNHAVAGYVKGTGVAQRVPYFSSTDTVTTSSRFIWDTAVNALKVNVGIAGTIGATLSGAFDGGSLQVWNGHELAVMGSTVGNSGDIATMVMKSNKGNSTANGYIDIQGYYAGGTTNTPIIFQKLGGVIIIGNIAAGADATSLLQVNGPIRQTSVTSALLKASATGVLQAAVAGTDYLTSTDLSNYYTQTQIQNFFSGASAMTGYNRANWDTAYGWGDHATAGYFLASNFNSSFDTRLGTKTTDNLAEGTTNLYYTNARARASLSAAGTGLTYNSSTGVFTWTNPGYITGYTETDPIYTASSWYSTTNNSSNWNTAYGWGNHAGLYSLLGHTHTFSSLTSKPTTLAGYGITDAATSAQGTKADTAYSWGDHSLVGYFLASNFNSSFDTRLALKSTTDLAEGINLYYTQGRFDSAFALKSTTNLAEGTNLYYTGARFNTAFAAKSTSDLSEGTNLYYTDARVLAYGDTQWVQLDGLYSNPTWITTLDWSKITSTPTTLAGYGITDGVRSVSGTAGKIFSSGGINPILTIDAAYIGQSSISNVGTITIGTWKGAAIADTYISSASNWNAAYSWGNHALAGYLTTISGIAAGGELAGTYANPTLVNSAVTGKLLSGVNITGGTILATDSILTAFGKVQNQINSLAGGMQFVDFWNATTNSPTIPTAVGNKGKYYIVQTAGTTSIDGITDWQIGDWVVSNGTTWGKIDNTDAVVSVNGFTGAVSLTTTHIPEGANLYFTDSRVWNALAWAAGTGSYNAGTGVMTLPTHTSHLTNNSGYITDATSTLTNYYTKTQIENFFSGASAMTGYNKSNWDTAYGWGNHAGLYYTLGSTVANSTLWASQGYSSSDQAINTYMMAYGASTGTWYPASASRIQAFLGYITGNQTITLSGDVSGSGTTAITTTIGAGKVTNAMVAGSIDYAKMNAATVPTWNQNTTGTAYNITQYVINQNLGTTNNVVHSTITASNALYTTANSGAYALYIKGRTSDNYAITGFYDNTGVARYGYIQSHSAYGGTLAIVGDGGTRLDIDSRGLTVNNIINGTTASFSGSVTASSFIGAGSALTSVPSNTALYPTFNQNTTGTAQYATYWGGFAANFNVAATTMDYLMVRESGAGIMKVGSAALVASFLSGQTMNIVGNATYAENSSKLYSTDPTYAYGSGAPYYANLSYNGSLNHWEFKMNPATPADIWVSRSGTATNVAASGVTGGAALSLTDDTNVTISQTGSTTALLAAKGLVMGWTGTLADSRITSAATWHAKQAAYTNLTTIGALANADGFLRQNGAGVFSYDTNTYYLASNPSGYISGNQTITLSGHVTGSGATSISTTIANGVVTTAMMASANISQWTNDSGYITGYTETDTLGSVTNRGNTTSQDIVFSNGRKGLVGVYDAAQTQAIFAMGAAYTLTNGGASNVIGNLYGLAWSYNPDYGGAGNNPQSKAGLNHQLLLMQAGVTTIALGSGLWTSGAITTTSTISASNFSGTHSGSSSGTNTGDQDLSGLALRGLSNVNGVLSSTYGGAGTINGILKANGSGVVSAAVNNSDFTLLNGTGFVRMSGTTPSYLTGASSQFVKADGSLDGNTYATTGALSGYLPLTAGSSNTITGALYINSSLISSNATYLDIYNNTVDGSDTKITRIGGGGDVTTTRGAFIDLRGNEATGGGNIYLNAGGSGTIIANAAISGTSADFANIVKGFSYSAKGIAGGWDRYFGFDGSSGTYRGGFGAFGADNALEYYYIGSAFNSNIARFNFSTLATTLYGALSGPSLSISGASGVDAQKYTLGTYTAIGYTGLALQLGSTAGSQFTATDMYANGSFSSRFVSGKLLVNTTTDNGTDALQVAGSGLFTGAVKTNEYLQVSKNGSNSVGVGGYFQLQNVAGTRQWLQQLNASNNIDWWYFDGTTWATPKITFTNTGAATFSSSVTSTGGGGYFRDILSINSSAYPSTFPTSIGANTSGVGYVQLGNNGNNYIVGGSTATGGNLMFYVNNTSILPTAPNGTLALTIASTGAATFSSSVTAGSGVYAGTWFYNSGKQGLYNSSYGGHFYQTDGNYWVITGNSTATMGLKFAYSHESTVYGYVYHDGSGFGLLNGGSWAVRTNGSSDNQLYGIWGVNMAPSGSYNFEVGGTMRSSGNAYAAAFVKASGTGDQYLMADGSVRVNGAYGSNTIWASGSVNLPDVSASGTTITITLPSNIGTTDYIVMITLKDRPVPDANPNLGPRAAGALYAPVVTNKTATTFDVWVWEPASYSQAGLAFDWIVINSGAAA